MHAAVVLWKCEVRSRIRAIADSWRAFSKCFPSHIPPTVCADSYFSVSLSSISLGALSTEVQSGNGRYAFNASSGDRSS
jgi:hypothetical protein